MQLLLQLRNSGQVSADGDWKLQQTAADVPKSLSLDDCAAQTFLFYTAGFDTSSSALTYCLYELVRNPLVMRKLQLEIDETLARHGGEITYDAIHEMHYLELCILGKWTQSIVAHLHAPAQRVLIAKLCVQNPCASTRRCRC